MYERQAVRINVPLEGGLVHEAPDCEMGHQQAVELLADQVRSLAAQGDLTVPEVGFQLVKCGLDLPSLVNRGRPVLWPGPARDPGWPSSTGSWIRYPGDLPGCIPQSAQAFRPAWPCGPFGWGATCSGRNRPEAPSRGERPGAPIEAHQAPVPIPGALGGFRGDRMNDRVVEFAHGFSAKPDPGL